MTPLYVSCVFEYSGAAEYSSDGNNADNCNMKYPGHKYPILII